MYRHNQFVSPKSPAFSYSVGVFMVENRSQEHSFHAFIVKLPSKIDTWPGRRSGDMIVITSILSVLVFLLLAGLLASVSSAVM